MTGDHHRTIMVACLFHTAKITIHALRMLVLFCSNFNLCSSFASFFVADSDVFSRLPVGDSARSLRSRRNLLRSTAKNRCFPVPATLPVLHTPDGTPGAFETSVIDSENRHVMIDIAVRSLVGAVLCGGPEIGALVKVILRSSDDIAGG